MMSAFLTTQDKIPGVVFNVYVFFCMLRKLLCADGIVLTKLWTGEHEKGKKKGVSYGKSGTKSKGT